MKYRSTKSRIQGFTLCLSLALGLLSCKPRAFNDASTASNPTNTHERVDALASSLLLYWPPPKNTADIENLPTVRDLGVSPALWRTVLSNIFLDNSTGRTMTLSTPECALSSESWRTTAARLSLYEIDLPGNLSTWLTLALQRESDLAQRVQLHLTLQPWCASSRLGRNDFVHTLDHAVQVTFDLSLPLLSEKNQFWLSEVTQKIRAEKTTLLKAENSVLPYATALALVNSGQNGRASIVSAWVNALKTEDLLRKRSLPVTAWQTSKQSLIATRQLRTAAPDDITHPTLKTNPAALKAFFGKYISEKNLIRIRAHVTEALGTAQWFSMWENQNGKLNRVALQTSSAQWDRGSGHVTFAPLLSRPQLFAKVGAEQPFAGNNPALMRDIDLDATPMANDIPLQDLLALNEKIIDHERTSVHTTRCTSCHALDDAVAFAREGRPVSQRGILPVQLTLNGVNPDGRPMMNLRSLRHAEADAARYEEESSNGRQPQSSKQ